MAARSSCLKILNFSTLCHVALKSAFQLSKHFVNMFFLILVSLPRPSCMETCDMCSFTEIRGRINELKLSTGASDMTTAGRAWASWWPLFTASSPPRCNSPSVKEKEKHLDHIPIHCIIHALLSHIKLYSPSAQERGVLMRAQYARYWIKIKTSADTETHTWEDNYTARSKKRALL